MVGKEKKKDSPGIKNESFSTRATFTVQVAQQLNGGLLAYSSSIQWW